jgi:hypothetical protein
VIKKEIPKLIMLVAFLIASISIGIAQNEPTSRPLIGEPPSFTPQASENNIASSLPEDQPLSKEQVIAAPSTFVPYQIIIPTGLKNWAFYKGAWSYGPAAMYLNGRMSILAYIDRSQNIYGYEKYYLSGREAFSYGGYSYGGIYVHSIFTADEPGWHALALYGDLSGWSSVIWIYVWPSDSPTTGPISCPGPTPGSCPIWTDKSEYGVGETITYYYRASTSTTATVTVTMPDGRTVQFGPTWISPGATQSLVSTAGYPYGQSIVVLRTGSGCSSSCSYNVYGLSVTSQSDPQPPDTTPFAANIGGAHPYLTPCGAKWSVRVPVNCDNGNPGSYGIGKI